MFDWKFQYGRLTADPELKQTQSGISYLNFSVATTTRYKGTDNDPTFEDWKAWRGTAETISKYFKKGQRIFLYGHAESESWEKEGKKYHKIVHVVDSFDFIDYKVSEKADNLAINEFVTVDTEQEELPFY